MALPRITSSVPPFAVAPLLNDNKNRGASSETPSEQTPGMGGVEAFLIGAGFGLLSLGVGVGGWMLWRRLNPPTPVEPQSTVTTPAAPPPAALPLTVSPALPTTAIATSLPPGATGLPDQWQHLETMADDRAQGGKPDWAREAYANALRTLFDHLEMRAWRRQKDTDPTRPMPHAGDVARLRQKLAALVTPSLVTGEGNEVRSARAILLLGPDLGKQAVEASLKAADSPEAAERLAGALNLVGCNIEDVPDFELSDRYPFEAEHFQALRLYAALLTDRIHRQNDTPQALAAVAKARKTIWASAPEGTPPVVKTEALRAAVHYYSQAIQKAVLEWQDPTGYVMALTELVVADDGLGLTSDVRKLALRFLSETDFNSGELEKWAALVYRAHERVPSDVSYAFDAATQLFKTADDSKAAEVFRKMFDAESPAGAAFEVVWQVGEFSTNPVLAALKLFGRQLDNEDVEWKGVRPDASFDLLQRTLAELVDAVIRSAAPDTPAPTLVEQLDPWTRYSAALTEVMASPSAQLAMDEVVLFLQSERGRLGDFDPVDIRRALKGEIVSSELNGALLDAIPQALRPRWQQYLVEKTAEQAEAAKRAAEKLDRKADKDAEWKESKIPVGAPPIL